MLSTATKGNDTVLLSNQLQLLKKVIQLLTLFVVIEAVISYLLYKCNSFVIALPILLQLQLHYHNCIRQYNF